MGVSACIHSNLSEDTNLHFILMEHSHSFSCLCLSAILHDSLTVYGVTKWDQPFTVSRCHSSSLQFKIYLKVVFSNIVIFLPLSFFFANVELGSTSYFFTHGYISSICNLCTCMNWYLIRFSSQVWKLTKFIFLISYIHYWIRYTN